MKKMFTRAAAVIAAGVFASVLASAPAVASVKITAYTAAPVRTGPYASSHQVATIQPGGYIYVDCWVRNSHGNLWYRTGGGHYTYTAHYYSYPGIYQC